MLGGHPKNPRSEQEVINGVDAEVVATGWVKSGTMMINNQLIVKNVHFCEWFVEKC
jgi:hypothetical protein